MTNDTTSSEQGVPAENRYTASCPCPACEGYESMPRGAGERCDGYISSFQPNVFFCRREESPEEAGDSGLFKHKLGQACGCGELHEREEEPPSESTDAVEPAGQLDLSNPSGTYSYQDEGGVEVFEVLRFETEDGNNATA